MFSRINTVNKTLHERFVYEAIIADTFSNPYCFVSMTIVFPRWVFKITAALNGKRKVNERNLLHNSVYLFVIRFLEYFNRRTWYCDPSKTNKWQVVKQAAMMHTMAMMAQWWHHIDGTTLMAPWHIADGTSTLTFQSVFEENPAKIRM